MPRRGTDREALDETAAGGDEWPDSTQDRPAKEKTSRRKSNDNSIQTTSLMRYYEETQTLAKKTSSDTHPCMPTPTPTTDTHTLANRVLRWTPRCEGASRGNTNKRKTRSRGQAPYAGSTGDGKEGERGGGGGEAVRGDVGRGRMYN